MVPGSHVVLVSTTVNHASTVAPTYLLYCSTKGAIEQMTKVLSKDLARKDISVNAVAPVRTIQFVYEKLADNLVSPTGPNGYGALL